ncbi:DNA cytosine methyltransferase [Hahella aquimaris]|uniref:DNA cytosine methyltransferase n=1 Tax=Hahella sp. HNIBRBA332 TaxID=3015983 RepID=UPI00273B4E9A|nr:DNA cytosine methyltransferase [Hahella sp. HNIBRBA332]WLQ13312.1 DNA cytosine methyltransferase [Hahella sp. HNIBRBA332]
MSSIELFAGAGGLAIGMSQAGFKHSAIVEWNADACETVRLNMAKGVDVVANWPQPYQGDAREFDYGCLGDDVVVVSGGPPCQPFSLGGKHQGFLDDRDMFPEAVRAVRELKPKAFIFENVKGLLRQNFAEYFEYVILQLTYPELVRKRNEKWVDHLSRLERRHTSGRRARGVTYNVVFRLLNAANYGVPQKRERVFIVGFRSDLGIEWNFPDETHSEEALLVSKWITGDYWERHGIAIADRPEMPARLAARIDKLRRRGLFEENHQPWVTVRDAICDLPDPEEFPVNNIPNHSHNPGARSYPGHTGSPWDEPAKTLKAGDHGVPGGENMLARYDGTVRYFTVREAARLQTFPDHYLFNGSWTETMRQLGNAVPVKLAETVAASVAAALREHI